MSERVQIRPATNADVAPIMEVLMHNDLLVKDLAYHLFTPPTLVAVLDGTIIGMIQAHPGHPYAVITECAVDPPYQKQGIGWKLLEAMDLVLQVMGCTAWVGYIANQREFVQQAVERFGARCMGDGRSYVKGWFHDRVTPP